MALGDCLDKVSSTQMPVIESQVGIPDDIFQAAVAASHHDSDGEDPYEPQPKRFMQTEHQKRQQKRDLEIRRLAWTMRKMRKAHKANHQRLKKQKQRPSPFEKLPSDLVLKLMQHTYLGDLHNLSNSSAINQGIFKANDNAIFRGMEIEQFPEWNWLLGDSKHRTPAQSQHLKDAIISEAYFHSPWGHGWAYDEKVLEVLRRIDNNEFTGVWNVTLLQQMQDHLDADIKTTESYTGMKIARRIAICLRSLGFHQPSIVKEKNRTEYGPLVHTRRISWEARSQLINEQTASIQAEIRAVLKFAVEKLYHRVEVLVMEWTCRHYRNPGNYRKPQEVKKWMSKLVTGSILEKLIPQWRAKNTLSSSDSSFVWQDSCVYLAHDLQDLLSKHDEGNVDVTQEVKNGVEFGKSIGMDLERLLDGTMVEACLDIAGSDGNGGRYL